MRHTILCMAACVALAAVSATQAYAKKRYAGGDISLLPEYEQAGAIYRTSSGETIGNLLTYCHDLGMNAMRVRLFVNPDDYDGADKDPNACQSTEYIIPLCRRIKEAGMDLILDFMYSDTWADPAKQWTPKAWSGMTDGELYDEIYTYTRQTLAALGEAGITPDFIQPGNEISYGMLWGTPDTPADRLKKCLMGSDANWERLGKLLSGAIRACREECPDASIIIHTERVATPDVQKNFYTEMERMEIDYDIIGLSYYPYWHGTLATLGRALDELETDFPGKDIMIVETGYPYKWEVPGTTEKVDFPYSREGQAQYAAALVETLRAHDAVTGLFWWWMEYNAYGTRLEGWYNAPVFDSTDGRATDALTILSGFADSSNGAAMVGADIPAGRIWYDLRGIPAGQIPTARGIYIAPDGAKVGRP